jgi:lyso-ornithine lipid O-acyltransferase
MRALRAIRILAGFLLLTVPLMPLQLAFLRFSERRARTFPNWYHRQVCRLLGLRFTIDGQVVADKPVLLVANHTSWLDIPAISSLAPVSFIAKKEVARWPFVASLAKLQRTVFVDRQRRTAASVSADEIAVRLAEGDTLVLFAEGTSSDGNRVLPFKTSLFAAAKPGRSNRTEADHDADTGPKPASAPPMQDSAASTPSDARVQTLTICYTHLHGIPLERAERPLVGWYGDMEMGAHAWELLKAGPLDVKISVGPPVPLDEFADRKALARHSEQEIRTELVRILRGRPPGEDIELAEIPQEDHRPFSPRSAASRNWV